MSKEAKLILHFLRRAAKDSKSHKLAVTEVPVNDYYASYYDGCANTWIDAANKLALSYFNRPLTPYTWSIL